MGDWIQIDNEQMLVQYVLPAGAHIWNVVVTRAYFGTNEAPHNAPASVFFVSSTTTGSAGSPGPLEIPTGTVTLHQGIITGGICIGAPNGWSSTNSGGNNNMRRLRRDDADRVRLLIGRVAERRPGR